MGFIIAITIIAVVLTAVYLQIPQSKAKKGKVAQKSELRKESNPPVETPYSLRPYLFTPAEQKFYSVLTEAIADDQLLFGKVRVADVLQPVSDIPRGQWQSAFNRISAKHFDYIICDRATLSIHSVIELQDKSHRQSSRVQRDQFLRKACKSAGLKLVEFKVKSNYSIADIQAVL